MGTRGRTSGAALSIATIGPNGIEAVRRPDPPSELTVEQAEEWRAIANSMAADHFTRETWPMLAAYCRHIVAARHVAKLIENCESGNTIDVEEYERLLRMQEKEGRAISSLATRMRLSQHARYDAKKKTGGATRKRPWEIEG